MTEQTATALPPVVDRQTWQAALDDLRVREKAATRELDAIAAQRRRLPMVELPDYTLIGPDGPIRLVEVFDGRSQLIVYNHMWSDGAEWQCGGCTSLTSQYVRLDFLDNYDARFVIVTNGPIEEALAYKAKVGNKMDWYSSSESSFGADVGAPPGAGFAVNVFLRDGDKVYRTWHTDGHGTEQLSYTFALIDILPWGRQEEWQDSPDGWPKSPTYSNWLDSPDVARLYGPTDTPKRGPRDPLVASDGSEGLTSPRAPRWGLKDAHTRGPGGSGLQALADVGRKATRADDPSVAGGLRVGSLLDIQPARATEDGRAAGP